MDDFLHSSAFSLLAWLNKINRAIDLKMCADGGSSAVHQQLRTVVIPYRAMVGDALFRLSNSRWTKAFGSLFNHSVDIRVKTATLSFESIRGLELKVLTIQRTTAGKWWNYKNVISPFSRLWLVLGGEGCVRHNKASYLLKPGSLHLVPAFAAHDCSCPERLDHYHLHFVSRLSTGVDLLSLLDCPVQIDGAQKMRSLFQRLETLFPGCKLPCFDPSNEEYRRYSISAEHNAEANLSAGDWLEKNGIVSLLLSPFVRTATIREGIHARVMRQFLAVQRHIHQNVEKPIVLADLARLVDLHPTYFSDRFLELVGERPLKYLMRYRLERAQYLLLTSRAPVKQVANEVGIPDQVYFTRVFRRFCGASPTEYRTTHST
jgi:AraC-like DNA-binding protein